MSGFINEGVEIMKNMRNLGKKAVMSALALSVGAVASAHAVDKVLKDPLFGLKELGSQTVLIAHEGKCGEGKCGEGKCGEVKATDKSKSDEGKCGVKKLKKVFKKDKATKSKSAEGKCGEGKCGSKK